MFERFTDRARRVVVLAQEEARMLRHDYIGTEHILLGLIHEGDGVAFKALESLDVELGSVRREVEEIVGKGPRSPTGHIPFTPRAKKVLELSLREALQLGHTYIGTEHILLGLVREGEGVAAQILQRRGVDLVRVRQTVIQLLSGYAGAGAAEAAGGGTSETSALVSEVVTRGAIEPTESVPTCPTCRSALSETLTAATVELKDSGQTSMVKMAYCSRCGTALGTVP